MRVNKYKNIELIEVFERMTSNPEITYTTPQTLAKIKTGSEFVYIMPYGTDYECEDGHHCEILTQEEFEQGYSTTKLERR